MASTGSGFEGLRRTLIAGVVAIALVFALSLQGLAPPVDGQSETDSVVSLPPSFIPSGAISWAEVDLSLSGEQRARADALGDALDLSGRQVPAAARIAKLIDTVLQSTPYSWARDIRPWTSERLVLASVDPARPADLQSWIDSGVAGLEVTDGPAASRFVDKVRAFAEEDFVFDEAPHGSTTIVTATPRDGYSSPVFFALVEGWLLGSTEPDILGAAIDATAGRGGLAVSGEGRITTPTDAPGSAWVDLERLIDWAESDPYASPTMSDLMFLSGVVEGKLPTDLDGHLSLDPDGLGASMRLSLPDESMLPKPRTTDLAASMPASTLAYLEVVDVGTIARELVSRWRYLDRRSGGRGISYTLTDLGSIVGFDLEDLLSVMDEAAVGVSSEAGMLQVGAVASLNDPAEAERLLETFTLAMRTINRRTDEIHVDVSTSTVAGVPIMQFSVAELQELAYEGIPADGTVSIAIDGQRLLIGNGSFVADALAGYGVSSLLLDPRYVGTAIGLDAPALARAFVDVRHGLSVLELISGETFLDDEALRGVLDTASAVVTSGPGSLEAHLHATLADIVGDGR